MRADQSCWVWPSRYQPNPIGFRQPNHSSQVYPVGKCDRKYSTETNAIGTASQSGTPTRSSLRASQSDIARNRAQQNARKSHEAYMAGWATRIHWIAGT
jgi:hypothetical protein